MDRLNSGHCSTPTSLNGFGDSGCECSECQKNAVSGIRERIAQIDKTVAELKILSDMLDSPYKKGKLCEVATMLRDWAKNMEVEVC